MDVIGTVAFVVALLGLLAAADYGGYLLVLRSMAAARGARELSADMGTRVPGAVGLTAGALVALIMTNGGVTWDVIGLLLGGGLGLAAVTQLQAARHKLASPPR